MAKPSKTNGHAVGRILAFLFLCQEAEHCRDQTPDQEFEVAQPKGRHIK